MAPHTDKNSVGPSTISRIHDLWLFIEKYSTTGVLLTRFKQLSSEENEKFDAGSRVNFNNVNIQREGVPGKNYVVVTILVAANGMYKVPATRSRGHQKCLAIFEY